MYQSRDIQGVVLLFKSEWPAAASVFETRRRSALWKSLRFKAGKDVVQTEAPPAENIFNDTRPTAAQLLWKSQIFFIFWLFSGGGVRFKLTAAAVFLLCNKCKALL